MITPTRSSEDKLEAQLTRLKLALADAITQWAGVEDNMAFLLNSVLGRSQQSYGLLIYFVPTAIEIRFAIVNDVIKKHLESDPALWDVARLWPKVMERLNRARKLRNKLAHGATMRYRSGRIETVRLTGPTFLTFATPLDGQMPGMSLHDVEATSRTFWHVGSGVSQVSDIIEGRANGLLDIPTLQQRAHELEEHLTKGAGQSGDGTPPQSAGLPPQFQE